MVIMDEQLKQPPSPSIVPFLFYVVARNSEDDWEQITQGLNTYEEAKTYMGSDFCQKRWENAFIVCTIKET